MKVLAVDDHPLVREGLARILTELDPNVEVLHADCVGGALARLGSTPDLTLILLELMLPDSEGLEGLERVRAARPDVPVVVLSARADKPEIVRAAIGAGAKGVLPKRCAPRVLVEALRLVLVGGVYVPPQALGSQRDAITTPASMNSVTAPTGRMHELGLTPRQTEVLELMMQGKPNKLICRALNLAEATVKTHAAAIYQALGVSNRTEAVFAVSRRGIQFPFAVTTDAPINIRDWQGTRRAFRYATQVT
jgi:DNA-binding NarL/FixJ family response regulator